jgi:hypothetical protein
LFGHIIRAVGEKKYLVRFDNGEEKECSSKVLKVENIAASLPADITISVQENVREEAILNAAIGEMEQDAEETEDLPARRPEEDELEHEEFTIPDQQADCEGRMPSQLPTAEQSTDKNYKSIKRCPNPVVPRLRSLREDSEQSNGILLTDEIRIK